MRYAIERKSMEEALFVEKERAEVTLNSIGDAVISTDIADAITFLNVVAREHDGLVVAGGRRPAHGARCSGSWTPRSRKAIANPTEMGDRARPDRPPAAELHAHPARRARDADRGLRRPDPRPGRARDRRR